MMLLGLLLVFQFSILGSYGSQSNTITVISIPAYTLDNSSSHKNDSQTGEALAGKLATTTTTSTSTTTSTPATAANYDDDTLSIKTMEEITSIGTHIINSETSNSLQEVGSSQDLSKTRYSIGEATESEVNDVFPKVHSLGIKSRRQAENYHQQSNGDWWTKLKGKSHSTNVSQTQQAKAVDSQPSDNGATKQKPKQGANAVHSTTSPTKVNTPSKKDTKRVVYVEQPLSQNAILTLRYQLAAIRNQHKVLVTKSMPQLLQLDNKLIDFYKLCMKKKMPLYAGMLYRTRDFTNRMAKDVKHERQVLEAMVRQVQNVLRQKMNNMTLVREYNQLVASPPSTATVGGLNVRLVSIKDSTSKRSGGPGQLPLDVTQQQQQKTTNATELFDLTVTTKRPKQRYTVSVNEVNLKKELTKIQTLIDRIDGSCHELNLVVDDINYLFKLKPQEIARKKGFAPGSKMNKFYQADTSASSGGMMVYDSKRRKIVKSPVKVFLEKYGNLTMAPPNADDNMSTAASNATTVAIKPDNLPTTLELDMKPLFEPSSMVYTDTVDQDLGFNEAVAVNSQ